MTSKLTQLGLLFLLLGATVLLTPSFGFETLAADRGFDAATASDENATVGFEPTGESIDNRSDSAVVFRLRNNAGEELTFATSHVLGLGDLLVTDDGSGAVGPGAANGVTVECGDYGGDTESTSITVTVTTATGDSLTIRDAAASTSFAAFCNVPALVWETDSDWSDGADANRTVSDDVGDRENDTVRLGYGVGDGNLVGYWPLDEDTGSTAVDATSNGNDGTVEGNPAQGVTGLLNATSYSFDGNSDGNNGDDTVTVPASGVLEPSDALTVSAWVRRDGTQVDYAKPVWYGQNTQDPWGPYGLEFDASSDTNLRFHLAPGGTPSDTGTVTLQDGQWHHVVGTYDGSTQRIYLDGEEGDSVSVSGSVDDYDGTNGLAIGDRYESGNEFSGTVDEVRIYDRALSAAEVRDLYYTADNGTHTTDWKTADGEIHPGRLILDNVSTALADGSASVTVQSDTDGDGTVEEESVPVELSDDASRYEIDGLTQSADRFRLQIDLSTPEETRTPIVESIELTEDHSNFEVAVDATNEPVVEGNDLNVDVTVENTGSDEATKTVELRDFGGTVEDSREVTLGAREQTQFTLTWATVAGDNGTGTVTVDSGDDNATAGVTVQQRPFFGVTVDGTNSPVPETDDLDVDVSVTNDGDLEDTQTVVLRNLDGTQVDSRQLTLSPGATKSFTLTWTTQDGDHGSGTVTVESGDDSVDESVTIEQLHTTSSCTTIDTAGTWRLTGNVSHTSGTSPCLDITVDDVTIQGQGYTVDMDGTGDDAIYAHRYNTDGDYTVRNLTIDQGKEAFHFHFVDRALIEDVTVVGASDGINTYNEVGQNDVGNVTARRSTIYDAGNRPIDVGGDGSHFHAEELTVGDPAVNGSTLDFDVHTTSSSSTTVTEVSDPASAPAGNLSVGKYVAIGTYNDPVENVVLHYDDADVSDVDERSLALWRDDSPWSQLDSSVDDAANTVSVAPDLTTATDFGLFAAPPPDLEVTIDDTSAPVVEGEDLLVNATVANNADTELTQTFELRDFDGTVVDSQELTVAGGGAEEHTLRWSTVEGDAGTGQINVSGDDDADTAEVTVEKAGDFSVSIDDTSHPVDVGEALTVDATVTNVGPGTSTQTVNLTVAGAERDTQTLTLDASGSQSITLEWTTTEDDVGIYDATVASPDDSDVAEVSVVHPDGPIWHSDADWSAGTHDRTVSDPVGDRENDTVRLGYPAESDGLAAYWPLDEDAAGPVADAAGSHDGTLFNESGITVDEPGVLNQSRYALEGGSHINVTDDEDFRSNGEFSMAFWVRTDSLETSNNGDNQTWFVDKGTYQSAGYELLDNGDYYPDNPQVIFRVYDGSTHEVGFERSALNDGTWHHVAAVKLSNEIRIYLDGARQDSLTDIGSVNHTSNMSIAGSLNNEGKLDGDLDEFRFYDRGLSDAEVAALNDTAVSGSHTTDWKPTGNALNASILQLQNVSASTAGENATVVVESDTDNDGVVDETSDGVRLAAGQSAYDVTGLETDATRTRLRVEFSTDDLGETPVVSRVELGERRPTFDVSIAGTNAPVQEGETLTVDANVTNTGTSSDTQTIELTDFDGTVVDSTNVTLAPGASNGSISLNWSTRGGDRGTDNVTVASPDDSAEREVTIEDGSQFDVTVDSTNAPITEGETLTVDVTVDNTGTANDTQTIELHDFGGAVVDSTTVTLDAGGTDSSIQLQWATQVGDNGTGAIDVTSADDSATRTVTVNETADFDVAITATNSPIQEGETLTVDANVTNTGGTTATKTVDLRDFGDTVVDSVDVTLTAGESNGTVTLEWATAGGDRGTDNVTVASPDDAAERQATVEDGSQFDVTVDSTNAPITEGEVLTANVSVDNTGTARDTQAIELHDFDGTVVDSTSVTLDAGAVNSSIQLAWDTQKGDNGTDAIDVTSADDSATQTVTIDQTAYFDVAIDDTNAPVMEGSDLTVDVNVTNVGDSAATQTIELTEFDGSVVDTAEISLGAGESDSSTTLTWSTQRGDNGTDTVAVSSENDTATRTVEVEREAYFAVSVDDTNAPEQEGEDVTFDVTVDNVGDRSATQTIELRDFDGTVVDTADVSLDADASNSSIQLVWSTQAGDNGTGTVTVASSNESTTRSVDVWTTVLNVSDVGAGISPGEEKQYFNVTLNESTSYVNYDINLSDAQGAGVDYSQVTTSDIAFETHSGDINYHEWAGSRPGITFQPSTDLSGQTIVISITQHQTNATGSDPWHVTMTDDDEKTWNDEFEYR